MYSRHLMIVSTALLVSFSGSPLGQEPAQKPPVKKQDQCSQFKLRVIAPNEEVDYKLTTTKPPESVEYKGRVINPCQTDEARTVKSPPPFPNNKQTPFMTPLFKQPLGIDQNEQQLKTPAEMLNQFQRPLGEAPKPKK
ncbi:MAG TPA: hypothetical protein VJ302_33315 [Blastocatellia bacterium]|nr:hypothetical protein [Blastocatellia bacterium]